MSRSLSLAAWLALRRGPGDQPYTPPARPGLRGAEVLLWAHCPRPDRIAAIPTLAEAVEAEGLAARWVVTLPGGELPRLPGVTVLPAPPEYRGPVRDFLAAIQPAALIWLDGDFRPQLLTETATAGFPRLLVEAQVDRLGLEPGHWIPGAAAALVAGLDHALAADHVAAHRLVRMGLADERVEVTGALDPAPRPPACNERERRDLAQTIGPRPIWLAAEVPLAEVPDVISAYRQAVRVAHRLLLILAPARAEDVGAIAAALRQAGLNASSRAEGAEPEEATEVYLADGPTEIGLWYRLAPITYLGGTLTSGATRHPYEAAALGTAILHGGATDPHAAAFARLTHAGAARAVRSGPNLGHAVEALLSPDRCAAMVQAAWEVATAGSVVANRVAELLHQRLEPVR